MVLKIKKNAPFFLKKDCPNLSTKILFTALLSFINYKIQKKYHFISKNVEVMLDLNP
jgi:hypothetical protein